MRNRVLHLSDNWRRLTCYRRLQHRDNLEIDAPNNAAELAIGWSVKERYRTMPGYKREASILNVSGLTAWLLHQSACYERGALLLPGLSLH
jgi:hypothetical protein